MTVAGISCVLALWLVCILPSFYGQGDDPHPVTIRPLKPYGIMVSVRDVPGMNSFEFEGVIALRLIDKLLGKDNNRDIYISVAKASNGFWTGKDYSVELRKGDVINYYINIVFERDQGVRERHTAVLWYNVTELYDSNDPWTCRKTLTDVKYKMSASDTYCAGQIIFEDDFNTLREDIWTAEYYIPKEPGYPFVSYQPLAVSVKHSMLRILPQLQQDMLGFSQDTINNGKLDLSNRGCTRDDKYCNVETAGPLILPPIVSGQITSATYFAFKYGVVEVRAKLPVGDWLYPDILLEALSKSSCTEHQRVLRIAGARGNLQLSNGREEYGNKVLYAGPLMDDKCRNNLLVKKISTKEWGDDFHVYSMKWEPHMITLSVDDEDWGIVNLTASGLLSYLPKGTCGSLWTSLNQPTCTIPFNDFFGITLGVSAGGMLEFPDGVSSGNTPKPWKNMAVKAPWHFYRSLDTWLPTWTQKQLVVDYIRVRAL